MGNITSYESFCKILQDGQGIERKQARLLLWLQNWIIQAMNCKKDHQFDNHLEGLLNAKSSKAETELETDVLGKILNESLKSMKHIMADNMRSRIIRENVVMPIHKVREINGYTMSWISRKSGETIYEKIASANNSIMAVQKRHTYDTLENRLFMRFLRELAEHLYTKLDNIMDEDLYNILIHTGDETRPGDDEILVEVSNFLNNPEYNEVKRWSNLPPNNTLLSEHNYNQIWRAWGELKRLDERFEQDMSGLYKHAANIFLIEILAYIKDSKSIRLPQEPIEVDYENYTVSGENVKFEALYQDNQFFTISKRETLNNNEKVTIYLSLDDKFLEIEFANDSIKIYENDVEVYREDLSLEALKWSIQYSVNHFGFIYLEKAYLSATKVDHIILDVFSLYPKFMDSNECIPLTNRLLYQSYKMKNHLGEEETYQIPCDNSSAIKMIDGVTETFSLKEAIKKNSFDGVKKLLSLFDSEIEASSCHFMIPDIYDEFQLAGTLNVVAKLQYGTLKKTPLSIGAAFQYQNKEYFKNFNVGNEVLVIIDLVDENLVFTLLDISYDHRLDQCLKYKGVLWERHPRRIYSVKDRINKVLKVLEDKGCTKAKQIYDIWGLDGFISDSENLSIYFGNKEWFTISQEIGNFIKEITIDIQNEVSLFLRDSKYRIGNKRVNFISVVDQLSYRGPNTFIKMSREDILLGCKHIENAEKELSVIATSDEGNSSLCLWKDFLEPLAIKRLIGEFKLISEGQSIAPIAGRKVDIPISEVFTLKAGVSQYEFSLLKGEGIDISKHSAVIKNDIPFDKDIDCFLQLTYEYVAETPYELVFRPLNKEDMRYFKSKKVIWEQTDYKKDKLPRLGFPEKLSWEQLRAYPSNKGYPLDVADVLAEEYFLLLSWGKETIKTKELYNLLTTSKVKDDKYISMDYLNKWIDKSGYLTSDYISYTFDVITIPGKEINRTYCIRHIVEGEEIQLKEDRYTNPYYTKWLFTLFLGNRVLEEDAPYNLLNNFKSARENWLNMYDEVDTPEQKRQVIRRLSLAGKQLGTRYFNIAHDYLSRYKKDNITSKTLPFTLVSELGYGLSDLATIEEQELLQSILNTEDKENVIGVLSKAIWHSKDFLENVNIDILLDVYMPEAVRFIHTCTEKELYKDMSYNPYQVTVIESGCFINYPWDRMIEKKMGACFEFIAGLLRLKYNGNEKLNTILSVTNSHLKLLIQDIEKLYSNKFDFHTYLEFPEDSEAKGEYSDMNTIMFIILVYITGYDVSKDISVLGYDYRKL